MYTNNIAAHNLRDLAQSSNAYLHVVETTDTMQVVSQRLLRGEIIPQETHARTTQTIHVTDGSIEVFTRSWDRVRTIVMQAGDFVVIPPQTTHEVHPRTWEARLVSFYSFPAGWAPHTYHVHVERQSGAPRLQGAM